MNIHVIVVIACLLISSSIRAEFNSVSLNGSKIDPRLFDLAKQAITKESDYCVPDNNEWVREYLVMFLLTKAQAESESELARAPFSLSDFIQHLWLNDTKANDPDIKKTLGGMFGTIRFSYLSILQQNIERIPKSSIQQEYDRLLLDQRPLVSDAVFVKTRQLMVPNSAAKEVDRRISNGNSLMDLYRDFDPDYRHDIEGQYWVQIAASGRIDTAYALFEGSVSGFSEFDQNIQKGRVLGPRNDERGNSWYLQIVDKLSLDFVSLQNGLPGESDYLSKKIRRYLKKKQLSNLKRTLRDNAVVRVDGEVVYANESSYDCGRVKQNTIEY